MSKIGNVSLQGLYPESLQYSFLGSSIVVGDVGKVVTLDTAAANTVKLAGDADNILGKIMAVEVRVNEGITVVTVSLGGGMLFDVNPNATASTPDETPAIGDMLEGATNNASVKGFVQRAQAARDSKWQVVELINSGAQVVAIKL